MSRFVSLPLAVFGLLVFAPGVVLFICTLHSLRTLPRILAPPSTSIHGVKLFISPESYNALITPAISILVGVDGGDHSRGEFIGQDFAKTVRLR